MTTFIDASLRRFDIVWAAGGTPHCVFTDQPSDELGAHQRRNRNGDRRMNDTFLFRRGAVAAGGGSGSATYRSSYRPCAMFRGARCASCCANA